MEKSGCGRLLKATAKAAGASRLWGLWQRTGKRWPAPYSAGGIFNWHNSLGYPRLEFPGRRVRRPRAQGLGPDYPQLDALPLTPLSLVFTLGCGVAFGLTARGFATLVQQITDWFEHIPYPPLRLMLGRGLAALAVLAQERMGNRSRDSVFFNAAVARGVQATRADRPATVDGRPEQVPRLNPTE